MMIRHAKKNRREEGQTPNSFRLSPKKIRKIFIFLYGLIAVSLFYANDLTLPFCCFDRELHASPTRLTTQKSAPIYLIVSSIWEGESLNPFNLEAIRAFKNRFPKIKMIHFLNGSYFTKPDVNKGEIARQLKTVITEDDEVGVAIYPWRSIVEMAKVEFRTGPRFWSEQAVDAGCLPDCGRDVALTVYSEEEIAKIFSANLALITESGFKRPRSYTVGGWLSGQKILEAAAANGLEFDFSPVPLQHVKKSLYHYPIYQWLKGLWPDISSLSGPYVARTQKKEMTRIVFSASTADYLGFNETIDVFKDFIREHQRVPHMAQTFHLSFYQETAYGQLPKVSEVVREIFALSEKEGIDLLPINYLGSREVPGTNWKESLIQAH